MNIHINNEKPTVVTVGTFDGIHQGHQFIINKLINQSREFNYRSLLVSFFPTPKMLFNRFSSRQSLLTTTEEKLEILSNSLIDEHIVLPFTAELAKMSAYNFIKEILIDKFHLKHLILGYNHKLGKDQVGNVETFNTYSQSLGFTFEKCAEYKKNNKTVSSTIIRELLIEGDIKTANVYLGYEYFITGEVIQGNKVGRNIDFPTANISIYDQQKTIPARGVYAVSVIIEGINYKGMANIGYNPTMKNDKQLSIEVHLFDFNQNIYGKKIRVHFKIKIRDEKKFPTIILLREQLVKDKKKIRNL